MKIISIATALALFLLPDTQILAKEPIDGAFGIKLGQEFDVASAIGKSALTDGTPMYQFSPENKFKSFSRYYILVTPKSNRVYGIWGIGDSESTGTCQKEQTVLMKILSDKYGEPDEEGLFSTLYDAKMITQGDRFVMTKCTGIIDISIEIRYKDSALENLAEEERIDIEVEQTDASSL